MRIARADAYRNFTDTELAIFACIDLNKQSVNDFLLLHGQLCAHGREVDDFWGGGFRV